MLSAPVGGEKRTWFGATVDGGGQTTVTSVRNHKKFPNIYQEGGDTLLKIFLSIEDFSK